MSKLPVLGPEGWLSDEKSILPMAFAHLFVTEGRQSNLYFGEVTSIKAIIRRNPNDINAVIADLNQEVKKYLERYFKEATVVFTDATVDEASQRELTVRIDVITNKGKRYNLGTRFTADLTRADVIFDQNEINVGGLQ